MKIIGIILEQMGHGKCREFSENANGESWGGEGKNIFRNSEFRHQEQETSGVRIQGLVSHQNGKSVQEMSKQPKLELK
jgi:hypothetical protein